jgi:S-formylglutathione hydrolase
MADLEIVSTSRCFGGEVRFLRHASQSTRCDMELSVFVPPRAADSPVPVLYWLSGLTCTAENFTGKAGAQRLAAEHGLLVVAPDTSPRGKDVPDVPERWDLGQGAGFYLNATTPRWRDHYRMYDYVVDELPELVRAHFRTTPGREAIAGHSMGGHGALVCALRNPGRYRSVSAFAPISTPSEVQWGRDAFTTYLGADAAAWSEWDANALVAGARERLPILIDQGTADRFLGEQLRPETFAATCARYDHPCETRMQPGYDHSYFFVASFLPDHFAHHAAALKA